jgi:hypothetical protein
MAFSEEQIEGWLKRVLVPVEPSPQFINRLRGRLVHVRGERGINLWTMVVLGVGLLLVVSAWMGLALRLLLALIGVIGVYSQRRAQRAPSRLVR